MSKPVGSKSQVRIELEDSVTIQPAAKIHRASIISRILNSLANMRAEWALHRLILSAKRRQNSGKRMLVALNGIFRKNRHELCFTAFQRINRQLIIAGEEDLSRTQKVIQVMASSSKRMLLVIMRSLVKEKCAEGFNRIKSQSNSIHFERRNWQRKCLRNMLGILLRNKRWAFGRLCTNRFISERRHKIKSMGKLVLNSRKASLAWGWWKLKKQVLFARREQVLDDIKVLEEKISCEEDPEMAALEEKKLKFEEHLEKLKNEKEALEGEHQNELREVEEEKEKVVRQRQALIDGNSELEERIAILEKDIKSPFTMDEIYQCLYNNFLVFIEQNKEQVYKKEDVLASLTCPLVPIEVPIQAIREENQVMKELLSEYVVMFGHKKMEEKVELPYEFIVKENYELYKMLLTLLPESHDREDMRLLKDGLYKLNVRVNEVWGSR